MSIKAMTYYWGREDKLQPGELLVLMALSDWAGDDGTCYPNQKSLARKCRYSYEGVRDVLDRLVKRGEVFSTARFEGDMVEGVRQTSNRYYLTDYRRSIGLSNPGETPGGASDLHGGVVSQHHGGVVSQHQPRTVTNEPSNTPAPQGEPSAPHGSIQSMVMAYFEGLKKCGKVVDTKKFPRYVRTAKAGLELGFTPEQVMASTIELSRQPFWSDKMVPLEKVIERLQAAPVTIRKQASQVVEPTNLIDPFSI